MGLLDSLGSLFKGKNTSDLLEEAQEKLQDGSLDGILKKVGVNGDQVGKVAIGVIGVVGLAKKAFGNKKLKEIVGNKENAGKAVKRRINNG